MPPARGGIQGKLYKCDLKNVDSVNQLTTRSVAAILEEVALLETKMPRWRGSLAISLSLLLSISLVASPLWGNPELGVGSVVSAERAHLGTAAASAGATVFVGDKLDTERAGSLQIRAGTARVLLQGSSRLTWGSEDGAPSATLTGGTAAFSTNNAKAIVFHAGTAVFRPRGDEPTIGNVTLLNPKELLVRCSRGALLIAVEDDVRMIPEGTAYRVVLDPEAAAAAGAIPPPAAEPAAAPWGDHQPRKPGKSKFLWYAIAFTALVTWFALSEAMESPDRP
jgi:hypothetical protein